VTRAASTGINPRLLALIQAERPADKRVLDVGCGWGRLTLRLAPEALRVIGLDRDPGLIAEGRRRAVAAGVDNVEFHGADVDREDYARFAPDLVTSHLFASDGMVERAGAALAPGRCLAVLAFHVDQWRETGRVSRFAYDEARMQAVLERAGFAVEALDVDREEQRFGSIEEGLAAAVGLQDRWQADGRWFRYIAFLESGGRTLTRSHLIAKGRKR
jgi:SAM-dependent methyltransferase